MGRERQWSWIVVGVLLLGLLPLAATSEVAGAPTHKLLVDRADAVTLADLQKQGAHLVADYGAFSLWQVPDATAKSLSGRATVQQRDDFDDLLLRNGTITPTSGVPPVPTTLRQSKASGKQFWLVQFIGPIKPDWRTQLTDLGAEIVSYLPNNAYVIWVDGGQLAQVEALAAKATPVQWTGAYEPAYRLESSLQRLNGPQMTPVTIQFYRTASTAASIAAVEAFGGTVLMQPEEVLGFTDISLEVPANQLVAIANRADVFDVEPYAAPRLNDEAQGQIVAGNLTTSGGNVVPTGAGYLAWLASKGFPTDPAQYPVVDIVDSEVDNGTTTPLHPDFYQLGQPANGSRVVAIRRCITFGNSETVGGHGNINAGIVGGYNDGTGAANEDANGYQYGLGIAPYTRLAGTTIFHGVGTSEFSACGGTFSGEVAASYANGATFTTNSWGTTGSGFYTAGAQTYDALTRDASSTTAGNQQMLHIFSAGNSGATANTIGSPGSAKNVLTVGATENVRDDGIVDGCGSSTANNADDIATFSSRGPTADGRTKPDIMAPGIHIQGPAMQVAGFAGAGICGAAGNLNSTHVVGSEYYPSGQTRYSWSSGTSHSAPAVAGAASLLWNYYGRVIKPGQTPSPAMIKALLLNTPRYLNGSGTGGTLPSNNQGWGDVNLGTLFDGTNLPFVEDQKTLFTQGGETYTRGGAIHSGSKPFRVTLVWTDAAGPTTGAASVNDLNLTVTVGANTYKGNVFSGANSTTGGAADAKNNVESVFLPAGTTGTFTVTVTATSIPGKAVPDGAGINNQDFALVISNGDVGPVPNIDVPTVTFSDATTGNNNGTMDPGETVTVSATVRNNGDAMATAASGTLSVFAGPVTINGSPTINYGNLAAGTTASGSTFSITYNGAAACGAPVSLRLVVSYNSGASTQRDFVLFSAGSVGGTPTTFTATDVPKAIPDGNLGGVTSIMAVAPFGTIAKVVVHLTITHTFDSDLAVTLTGPNGTTVTLFTNRGSNGHNFTNTTLDDNASISMIFGAAPFTGPFQPEQPLSRLSGWEMHGNWQLTAVDSVTQDTGTIQSWSLDITPAVCEPLTTTISSLASASGSTAGGNTVRILGKGFQSNATVTVGGTPVTPTSITGSQITLVMPPHAAGAVTVAVTTTLGAAPTAQYTYGGVSSLPPSAPSGGGNGSPGAAPNPRPAGAPAGSPPGSLPNSRP